MPTMGQHKELYRLQVTNILKIVSDHYYQILDTFNTEILKIYIKSPQKRQPYSLKS